MSVEHKLTSEQSNGGLHIRFMAGPLFTGRFAGQAGTINFNYGIGLVYLIGKRASAFEIGLGVGNFSRPDFPGTIPTVNLGYRYQGDKD